VRDNQGKRLTVSEFGLKEFVRSGGAVLIATDRKTEDLVEDFGVEVSHGPVCVRGSVTYTPDGFGFLVKPTPSAEIFGDLIHVATIGPGYIQLFNVPPNLHRLADFPQGAHVSAGRRAVDPRLAQNQHYAFAVGGGYGKGRFVILADQCVFSNGLLWQTTGPKANDNFEFASNCVNWLTSSGTRRQVLFIEEGEIINDFYTNFKEEPPPPLPGIEHVVHAVNQGLYGVEKENHFNEWIGSLADGIKPWTIVVILTVALVVYGLIRLGQAKHYVEPGAPSLAVGLAQLVPSTSVLSQRQRWMLREGNFAEVAQTLARQFFDSLEKMGPAPPSVHTSGGWWRTRRMGRDVHRLWRLAHGNKAQNISPRRLTRLRATVERLKTAVADGTLRIGRDES
jgi:hypothetical protein